MQRKGGDRVVARDSRERADAGGVNHPHIGSIYGLDDVDGFALVIVARRGDADTMPRATAASQPGIADRSRTRRGAKNADNHAI